MGRLLVAVSAVAMVLSVGAAKAANQLGIDYFEITDTTPSSNADFGQCCSSSLTGPATTEGDLTGSSLVGGLPVVGTNNDIASVSTSGQILWWSDGVDGVSKTGSGTVTLPYSSNMYAPNSTGENDANFYETAALWGSLHATGGADVTISVSGDDDVLVYLNGAYVGGAPGVHGTTPADIYLGVLSAGTYALNVFYADRAQTGADFSIDVSGATTMVPEPSTWVMMGLGFAGLGFAGFRARKAARFVI